uniref:Reverse transcriptase Ty1/copia-type domain-containing protein n=1 Tax=Tanacetum cinerariifolium TaxID=118510 RepID=A0A699GTM6_TANCI|nr:hypothetical protein [Tanacetum cinerariifolium]GEW28193.1 hypothetical protein [Tanacetum cinerariifolium]
MGKIVTELHAMLKVHEQTLPPKEVTPTIHAIRARRIQENQKKKSHKAAKENQGKGKAKMGYTPVSAPTFAPKPKNPPTPKKDNPAKDAICHQCGEVACGDIKILSAEEAWETIKDCVQCDKQWKNPTSTILDQTIANLKTQLVENEVVRVKIPKYMAWLDDELIGDLNTIEDKVDNPSPQRIPMEVEPLDHTKLEDLGLNTCNHDIPLSFKEIPSVDEPEPQPLPNLSPLDVNLGDKRGTDPPINPYSPSSFRMKMQSMKYNEVWELVDLPPNGKTVGHKWLFKKKIDMDGATFSPVADIKAIRILIAIDAFYDYEIWQMDVKTDFLNAFYDYEETFSPVADIRAIIPIHGPTRRILYGKFQTWNDPNARKLKFSKSQGASTPAKKQCMQNISYASAVGSIMYAVRYTRPDVVFAQNITCRFQQNPSEVHWTAVKNILKYLRNTKDVFLVYGDDTKRELRVSCYTDAGYLTDDDDIKSQTGYAVWNRKFVFRLGVVPTIEEPINMYCDNTRAIAIAKDHGVTKGARHFRVKVYYLRETIEMGDVRIEKVDTDDYLADPFTKALAFPKHSELKRK